MAQKILIVDDELETLKMLELTLQVAGYEVAIAASGRIALSLMPQFKPDAIILDVMMPEESGIDVLKKIRKQFPDAPPVIIFSARGNIDNMVEGMEAGAFKYLVKPITRDKLLETVKSALVHRLKSNPQG